MTHRFAIGATTALLCAGVLSTVPAAAAPADGHGANAPGAPAPCRASNLSVGQDRSGHDAGLGHFGMDIVVTNAIDQPCTLRGYLGLRFLDHDQRPLRTDARPGDTRYQDDPGPATIVLRAGRSATANLMWAEATAPGDPVVRPAYLRIGTPGAPDGSFTIPFDEDQPGILQARLVNTALGAPR